MNRMLKGSSVLVLAGCPGVPRMEGEGGRGGLCRGRSGELLSLAERGHAGGGTG